MVLAVDVTTEPEFTVRPQVVTSSMPAQFQGIPVYGNTYSPLHLSFPPARVVRVDDACAVLEVQAGSCIHRAAERVDTALAAHVTDRRADLFGARGSLVASGSYFYPCARERHKRWMPTALPANVSVICAGHRVVVRAHARRVPPGSVLVKLCTRRFADRTALRGLVGGTHAVLVRVAGWASHESAGTKLALVSVYKPRPVWSPARHALWPDAQRAFAVELLRVHARLRERWGVPLEVWVGQVMPRALA